MLNTFFRVFQPCFSEINMLKNIMGGSVAFVVDMWKSKAVSRAEVRLCWYMYFNLLTTQLNNLRT